MGVGGSQKWRHLFWIVPALLLAGFVLVVGDAYLDDRLYAERSIATTAVVTKKTTYQRANYPMRYYLAYRFATAAGQGMDGDAQVERSDWDKVQEQQAIAVRYVLERPALNRLDPGRQELDSLAAGVMLLVCLAVLVAGVLLFLYVDVGRSSTGPSS